VIDRLTRALHPGHGLRALVVRVGDLARMTRLLHGLAPTSARLFAEGLAAAALLGALQKDEERVNLQLECDGPLRGLFVDADPAGNLRGYVRGPEVDLPGDPAAAALAALGGGGFLSVLRVRTDGTFYRSSVELRREPLAWAVRRWFAASDQVETALALEVLPRGDEPLGQVAGLLVQRLPGGEGAAVVDARDAIDAGALDAGLEASAPALALLEAVAGPGWEVLAEQEVAYRCGCSLERVRNAVTALGADGLADLAATVGQAEVDCEFCHAHYLLDAAALGELEQRLRQARPEPGPDQ
jgi:molecular chaperone Hsp33